MTTIRCAPLELPAVTEADLTRADLVFYGVDHAGPSYEALIYVDPADDDVLGTRDTARGYAGSFSVFGHLGCYGDEGHCLPADRHTDEFDRRPSHPLKPLTKAVIATAPIREAVLSGRSTVDVIVVTVVPEDDTRDESQPMPFELVRLLTYQS